MPVRPTAALALSVLVTAGLSSPAAFGQSSSSALINEALDKLIDLDLNTTLPQAIKQIEDKTGVPIHAGPAVYDLLPWGDQTKLTARLSNQTLRQALTALTAKLGLRFVVGDTAVELQPIPALDRVARRVTLDELGLIDDLTTRRGPADAESVTVGGLADRVDRAFKDAKAAYVVDNRTDRTASAQVVRLPRDASLLQALEELHRQSGATWYPSGRSVTIVPKGELVGTLLSRPISMRFNGVDVSQVLGELSRRSGVPFAVEPGAVQRIPPESRVVRLTLENASTKDALESVAGFTGLGYSQTDNGVYVWNPAAQPVARRPDRTIAIIRLENGTELLLPENEVPADVKQYLQSKRSNAINAIREQMKKEGFKPTTQPADG